MLNSYRQYREMLNTYWYYFATLNNYYYHKKCSIVTDNTEKCSILIDTTSQRSIIIATKRQCWSSNPPRKKIETAYLWQRCVWGKPSISLPPPTRGGCLTFYWTRLCVRLAAQVRKINWRNLETRNPQAAKRILSQRADRFHWPGDISRATRGCIPTGAAEHLMYGAGLQQV